MIPTRPGSSTHSSLWTIILVQPAAVLLGIAWGFALLRGPVPHSSTVLWPLTGCAAVVLLGIECLRSRPVRQHGSTKAMACGLSMSLVFLALFIMFSEQFIYVSHSESLVLCGITLILPFIVAVSVFVRSRCWFGMSGAVLFVATSCAMLTYNGFLRYQGVGFFAWWVY